MADPPETTAAVDSTPKKDAAFEDVTAGSSSDKEKTKTTTTTTTTVKKTTSTWRHVLSKHPATVNKDLERWSNPRKSVDELVQLLVDHDHVLLMGLESSQGNSDDVDNGTTTTTTTTTNDSPSSNLHIQFYHHVTRLSSQDNGDGTDSNQDTPKLVMLQGGINLHQQQRQAQPVVVQSQAQALDVITVKGPSWVALKAMDTAEEATKPAVANCSYQVRPLQPVPNFLAQALMKTDNHHSPADLLVTALQAIAAHDAKYLKPKSKTSITKAYDSADIFCRSVVAWLWCAAQQSEKEKSSKGSDDATNHSKLNPIPCATQFLHVVAKNDKSQKDVLLWSQQLHAKKIRSKTRTWDESYAALVAFKAKHGHCNVPRVYEPDKALGEWVKNQRSICKTMAPDKKQKLTLLGFVFENTQSDRSAKHWETQYLALQKFQQQYGHCKPTYTKEDPTHKQLHHWVTLQRQACKKGQLSDERKQKLNDLGFVWRIKADYKPRAINSTKAEAHWNNGYQQLQEFHKQHGHVSVPKRPAPNRPLWEWVYAQRKAHAEQRLPPAQVQQMEALGMQWDVDQGQEMRDQQWNAKYQQAKEFYDQHQHLEVPRSGRYGNPNLLKWLLRQREQFHNDKLSAERHAKLKDLELDFTKDGNKERRDKLLEELAWQEQFTELQEHVQAQQKEDKDWKISKLSDKEPLGKWVVKQQVAHQFHDLPAERKDMLDKLGVNFPELPAGKHKVTMVHADRATPRPTKAAATMTTPKAASKSPSKQVKATETSDSKSPATPFAAKPTPRTSARKSLLEKKDNAEEPDPAKKRPRTRGSDASTNA